MLAVAAPQGLVGQHPRGLVQDVAHHLQLAGQRGRHLGVDPLRADLVRQPPVGAGHLGRCWPPGRSPGSGSSRRPGRARSGPGCARDPPAGRRTRRPRPRRRRDRGESTPKAEEHEGERAETRSSVSPLARVTSSSDRMPSNSPADPRSPGLRGQLGQQVAPPPAPPDGARAPSGRRPGVSADPGRGMTRGRAASRTSAAGCRSSRAFRASGS